MPLRLFDLLLNALALAALPCLPIFFLTRWRHGLPERLGRIPPAAARLRAPIWVHAASVGEVLSAEPLIELLRRDFPTREILLTTTSATGRQVAVERARADAVMLLPADVPWIVASVLRRLRPSALLLVETELWPSLLRAAVARKIPCALVSGRVSAAAAHRYARVGWLFQPALAGVSALAMQTDADAKRIISLGATAERVHVTGSLKSSRALGEATTAATGPANSLLPESRVLLVAASTHRGEEELSLDACHGLWQDFPDMLLVIAPRRPERFDEVAALLQSRNIPFARRTELSATVDASVRVLLLDSLGELGALMKVARGVYVGGTSVDVGGHNILEPALYARPAAFGPDTANVAAQAAALIRLDAAVRVRDAGELAARWRHWLREPALAEAMGARGREWVASQADAGERILAVLRPLLEGPRLAAVAGGESRGAR